MSTTGTADSPSHGGGDLEAIARPLDFDELPMPQPVRGLSLNSSKRDLKAFARRLDSYETWKNGEEGLEIELPDGGTNRYDISFGDRGPFPKDNLEQTRYPGARYDVGLNSAQTLEMYDGTLHIIFPIGTIELSELPNSLAEDKFYVVYNLDLDEFWTLFLLDYEVYDHMGLLFPCGESKDPRRKGHEYKRKTEFPGTKTVMSIGVLHGLFGGNTGHDKARLEVKDVEDFFTRTVVHHEGRILATVGNRIVDIGRRTDDGGYVEVEVEDTFSSEEESTNSNED